MSKPNVKVTNGQGGPLIIDDTAEHEGPFSILQAINDPVVLTTVLPASYNLDGKTLGAGVVITGNFTSVTRASGGDLAAYK